ncbi:MAG TPA: DUF255 domain-containing protein [Chitinophagaceae bacterium]
MKIFTSTLFFLHITLSCLSQVNFSSGSYSSTLQMAKESGRMIFIQFESETCDQCNEVADKAFEDKKLADQLEQGFISLKIDADHPDRDIVAALFNKSKGFGSLFISSDGVLIHTYPRTTTMASAYLKEIDIALTKAGEGLRVSDFEKEFKKGNKSPLIIEQLLILRRSLNLSTDSLLDEYVSLLPADSLQSVHTLLFIAQMDPVLDSPADKILRKNQPVFNKAWYTLSQPSRVGINNRILYKSIQKAIHEKNIGFAYRVAAFAKSTYTPLSPSGNKSYNYYVLIFYEGTHDTINYLQRAITYYDTYYMTVAPDSIKSKDSAYTKMLLSKQTPEKVINGNSVTYRKQVRISSLAQAYSRQLNNAAWNFYNYTTNPTFLQKALQWAARANEFFSSAEARDIYACLLYKTGNKDEAISWMSKAIQLKKERGFKTDNWEIVLATMKEGIAIK